MKLILLGTGTSTGIPEVACGCAVCQSSDSRDKRLRTSALLVTSEGFRILIDCGPDFRQQANRIGLDRVDAILLTHEHYDHVYGLDDLRTLAWKYSIPIYGQAKVLEAVRTRMHYAFGKEPYPGTARLSLHALNADECIHIGGVEVCPIVVQHGNLPIYAYRLRELSCPEYSISYITDMKSITPQEWAKAKGSQLLVINALRHRKEHPSHQSIVDVEALLRTLEHRPQLTVLTHLSHHAPSHRNMECLLAEDIRPAYDGLCISYKDGVLHTEEFQVERQAYNYVDVDCLLGIGQELKDIQSLTAYLAEEGSNLCLASYDKGRELLGLINLDRYQYPISDEVFRLSLEQALEQLLQVYQISPDRAWASCIELYSLNEAKHTPFVIRISVNHDTSSLYALSHSPKLIDMTVLKAQLTGLIYKHIKELMAPQFKSSLSNY